MVGVGLPAIATTTRSTIATVLSSWSIVAARPSRACLASLHWRIEFVFDLWHSAQCALSLRSIVLFWVELRWPKRNVASNALQWASFYILVRICHLARTLATAVALHVHVTVILVVLLAIQLVRRGIWIGQVPVFKDLV